MYSYLCRLLTDRRGGTVFTCFGLWHFLYLAAILFAILLLLLLLRHRSNEAKGRAVNACLLLAAGLYAADFFLMPFAYGAIDVEKLPFHACTLTCIASLLCSHVDRWKKHRTRFVLLGTVSNLVYLIYPGGVGWAAVHPLSYRVVQTLLYHGAMTAFGILSLALEKHELRWRTCYREAIAAAALSLWALLGNLLYNSPDRFYNWFFVVRDPFYAIPEEIAPFVMPFLTPLVFFLAVLGIYALLLRRPGKATPLQ